MKKNQNGFGLIESLLVIIALSLVVFVGYYVWNSQKNANKSLDNANKSSQSLSNSSSSSDTQKLTLATNVSFIAPKTWQTAKPSSFCLGTDFSLSHKCVDSMEISPTNAVDAQTNGSFGVEVNVFSNTANMEAQSWFSDVWGFFASEEWSVAKNPISGYDSLQATQSNSDYTDIYYVAHKNSTIVMITARTKEKSSSRDDTKYNGQIKQIAESIQIKQ